RGIRIGVGKRHVDAVAAVTVARTRARAVATGRVGRGVVTSAAARRGAGTPSGSGAGAVAGRAGPVAAVTTVATIAAVAAVGSARATTAARRVRVAGLVATSAVAAFGIRQPHVHQAKARTCAGSGRPADATGVRFAGGSTKAAPETRSACFAAVATFTT